MIQDYRFAAFFPTHLGLLFVMVVDFNFLDAGVDFSRECACFVRLLFAVDEVEEEEEDCDEVNTRVGALGERSRSGEGVGCIIGECSKSEGLTRGL
jgi:hypothetical protein